MKDIACIGLLVCDVLASPVEKSIFENDTGFVENLKVASGGDALNAAVNIAKLGFSTAVCGVVGNDPFGLFLRSEAQKYGVNTDFLKTKDSINTSTSLVLIEGSGERHFAYYGKANHSLVAADVPDSLISDAKIVYVGSMMELDGLNGDGLADIFKRAHKFGALTSFDVTGCKDGKWLEKVEAGLYHTDIFLPSHYEACEIAGTDDVNKMAEFFRGYGVKVFGLKMGAKGCYVTDYTNEYYLPPISTENVVDTTGAGDAFVSGFLAATTKGWPLRKCALFGSAVSNMCIRSVGASTGIGTMEEALKLIENL